MSEIETVTLTGTSKKGKQRVKMHGPRWVVLTAATRVQFDDKPGPWVLVMPLGAQAEDARWVHRFTDNDFSVNPLREEGS